MGKEKLPQYGRVPYQPIDAGALAVLKPSDALVYLSLCGHSSKDWKTSVGQRRIASITGLKLGTVSAAINRLEDAGLIRKHHTRNGAAATYEIIPTVQRPPNGESVPTVQHTPNGFDDDRSAPAEQTVQRPQGRPFSAHRTDRSAPAERNIVEQSKETSSSTDRNDDDDVDRIPDHRTEAARSDDPELQAALEDIGLGKSVINEAVSLAAALGHTPQTIRTIAERGHTNRAGLVLVALRDGQPPERGEQDTLHPLLREPEWDDPTLDHLFPR